MVPFFLTLLQRQFNRLQSKYDRPFSFLVDTRDADSKQVQNAAGNFGWAVQNSPSATILIVKSCSHFYYRHFLFFVSLLPTYELL
jgi:hypothetical protein